ncbi:TetR family transcriptional regulator [Amycolatopsis ultiminotia]|uniref:TetR family transcriptional regulator n=1 Tax=Amycolatopsis ultiminotia TaxID=543629 RepID=A0ABP6WF30_9PSEU
MRSSSAPAGSDTRSRAATGRQAITAERVIDAAVRLTVEHGLEGWTLRRLAAELGAYPAVVYHHVGDRDAVVCAVLDRVVGGLRVPDPGLPWQEWFVELLSELRVVLRRHPGTARWMVLFGPSVQAATELLDRGVRMLLDAGFGEESTLAYHLLAATACQFVTMEDDRDGSLAERLDNTEEYAAYRDRSDLPGMAAHGRTMHRLLTEPGLLDAYFTHLYDYAVRRCLDGLTTRLADIRG